MLYFPITQDKVNKKLKNKQNKNKCAFNIILNICEFTCIFFISVNPLVRSLGQVKLDSDK
jgi:hypothetical protein